MQLLTDKNERLAVVVMIKNVFFIVLECFIIMRCNYFTTDST